MKINILISIRPRHCNDILNGIKEIELRKNFPACAQFPCKVYLCKTGTGGDIVGEFTCVDSYNIKPNMSDEELSEFATKACVTLDELKAYMNHHIITGWMISNVVDYTKTDSVKHISDFGVNKVPQSWCYVTGSDDDV